LVVVSHTVCTHVGGGPKICGTLGLHHVCVDVGASSLGTGTTLTHWKQHASAPDVLRHQILSL